MLNVHKNAIASALAASRFVGRAMVADMMTFDQAQACDANGNMRGRGFDHRYVTHDGKTVDSTGAFLVGELERLDQTMHAPLASVSWGRDIDLREDISIADDVSSFTLSTFASQGGLGGNGVGTGKAWAGKVSTQITGIGVDIAKIPTPLNLWAMEIKYTIPELESAAKLGRPIDQQKYTGLQLKHQMDIDEQVYIGDITTGATGLVNNARVTNVSNVVNGAGGSPLWANKTPDEILADVNELVTSVWAASAWAVMPDTIGLPPAEYGYLLSQKVSAAGNVSILKFLLDNNLVTAGGRGTLRIVPMKFLTGGGAGGAYFTSDGHDRMIAYAKDKERLRFPMTMLQRTPVQYEGLYHKATYYCKLGAVEAVYPETVGARDGLG